MIDYEKLKLAHSIDPSKKLRVMPIFEEEIRFHYEINLDGDFWYFTELDHLIDYLISSLKKTIQQSSKPEPKYKIGQKLYFKDDADDIQFFIVGEIEDGPHYIESKECCLCLHENECFPSRESLIDVQIQYWTSLKSAEKSTCSGDMSKTPPYEEEIRGFNDINRNQVHVDIQRCQHRQDFDYYCPGSKKCKKCGEFYR